MKKNIKSIKPEEFFKLISVHSGVDLDTSRDVFYGMIKTISRELKAKGKIKLPDWGEFSLKIHKERNIVEVNTKNIIRIPSKRTVKFAPDYKVKKYFKMLE